MSDVESEYYAFMDFDRAQMRDGRSHYVQYFREGPVLELACGRGEFLELLAEAGVSASGVDLDPGMVGTGRAAGLHVEHGDALAALAACRPESLGGLFCAHFLEHLPSAAVEQVYRDAARALRPGGSFVAAVPNMGSLSVSGYDFWRDPTHVRPYDPMVLAFFADRAGLSVVEAGPNPRIDPGPPPQLLPIASVTAFSVSDELAALREDVRRVHRPVRRRRLRDVLRGRPTVRPELEPAGEPWVRLTAVLGRVDDAVQTLQHHLYDLRSAYLKALQQLYPPNEVYVVARKGSASADGETPG